MQSGPKLVFFLNLIINFMIYSLVTLGECLGLRERSAKLEGSLFEFQYRLRHL